MQMRKWLALALTSALAGCYADPFPHEPDCWDCPAPPTFPPLPSSPSDPTGNSGLADFRVTSVTGPEALSRTVQNQLSARLCNKGDIAAGTHVSFYLSRQVVFDTSGELLGTSAWTFMLPDSCKDVSVSVEGPAIADGRYILIAIADPSDVEQEKSEHNNVWVGDYIRVGNSAPGPYPDVETDTTPPETPVITQASWQYGSSQHSVLIKGATEPCVEVGIFIDSECTGTPAATVDSSFTGSFTAQLTVPVMSGGTVRRVFVAARDQRSMSPSVSRALCTSRRARRATRTVTATRPTVARWT